MINGICSCPVGWNGSPCKHQYVIWASRISQSKNFLPYSEKEERQKYAMIAIGETLPLRSYEGLHEQVAPHGSTNNDNRGNELTESTESSNEEIGSDTEENESHDFITDAGEDENLIRLKEEAKDALMANVNFLMEKIDSGEKSLSTGIIKFAKRCKSIPISKLPSSFHEFGNNIRVAIEL